MSEARELSAKMEQRGAFRGGLLLGFLLGAVVVWIL